MAISSKIVINNIELVSNPYKFKCNLLYTVCISGKAWWNDVRNAETITKIVLDAVKNNISRED